MNHFILLLLISFSLSSLEHSSKDLVEEVNFPQISNILKHGDKLNKIISKDSIILSIRQPDKTSKTSEKDNGIIKDILPSLIAIIVVIISTLGAIYIGKKQINGSSKTALRQIDTVNRQAWVVDTRNTISKLITQANLLNIEFQEKPINKGKLKDLHKKFSYHKNKLSLLLNPNIEEHEIMLKSLDEMMETLDTHLSNSKKNNKGVKSFSYDNIKFMTQSNKVIESGRKLLYDEWERIQFQDKDSR